MLCNSTEKPLDNIGRGFKFRLYWKDTMQFYITEVNRARDIWADQKSKDIYESIIKYRANEPFSLLYHYLDPLQNQYLDEVVQFSDNETIVDAGGFDINTIKRVSQYFEDKNLTYRKYMCIEPVPEFYQEICTDISELGLKNVVAINKAICNKKGIIEFKVYGACSRLLDKPSSDSNGVITVETDTIDNMCSDDTPITFLKMDIEGAELAALEGAKNTIQRDKPKCAISVYHKPEDIFVIPLYLKQLNPDYKLYLRYYTPWLNEIVCYAI